MEKMLNLLFILLFYSIISVYGTDDNSKTEGSTDPVKIYQNLLKLKHGQQLEAVKSIMQIDHYSKQYKLVKQIFDAMKKVLQASRVHIESSDYLLGGDFPSNGTTREYLSKILENTAFFADMALRLPEITGKLYKTDNELKVLVDWSIGFSNSTGFYDQITTKLMHLVGQELGLIEKESNFQNPFRKEKKKKNAVKIETKEKSKEKKKEKPKKGPKMSSRREL